MATLLRRRALSAVKEDAGTAPGLASPPGPSSARRQCRRAPSLRRRIVSPARRGPGFTRENAAAGGRRRVLGAGPAPVARYRPADPGAAGAVFPHAARPAAVSWRRQAAGPAGRPQVPTRTRDAGRRAGGGIGRRWGLKIPWASARPGSTPGPPTRPASSWPPSARPSPAARSTTSAISSPTTSPRCSPARSAAAKAARRLHRFCPVGLRADRPAGAETRLAPLGPAAQGCRTGPDLPRRDRLHSLDRQPKRARAPRAPEGP